ncbi:MAG: polymerase family protein with 3-5-exonuclease and polymerase domain, partial [Blastococcus sp.]|nr:polymerase family protein with 3-5-exonuclease and polymerase domain [Blastococcus sp.]
MNRVVLLSTGVCAVRAEERAEDWAAVRDERLVAAVLAAFVQVRERSSVRWIWDDTTRWYPALLAAGVRVERCWDLRLSHAVLRR